MSFLNKDISLGSKQLNDKKKEGFYNELTLLLDAGVDIKSSLELIESEQVFRLRILFCEDRRGERTASASITTTSIVF